MVLISVVFYANGILLNILRTNLVGKWWRLISDFFVRNKPSSFYIADKVISGNLINLINFCTQFTVSYKNPSYNSKDSDFQ